MFLGIDVSTYLEEQRIAHSKYFKNGQEIDPFALFKSQGVTHLRTRVWHHPYDEDGNPYLGGTCDLNNCIELINKLKKYNFKNIIDFHYSDFWCDPSKQFPPKGWEKLSFEQILDKVYLYTKESLIKLKDNDIEIDYIQTGNEITHGILWPFGKIDYQNKDESYLRLAKILISARKACKEIYPEAKIIIHLEQSYDQKLYFQYFSYLRKFGLEFEAIGASYYPFWHHSFEEFFANMDLMRKSFNVEVMNMEVGCPFTFEDYLPEDSSGTHHLVINKNNEEDLKKYIPYRISKEGQKQFIQEFIKQAQEHHLSGVCYWEPLWIPGDGICWASVNAQKYQSSIIKDTRNEWANQCLIDYNGNVLPAFEEYKL